MDLAGLQVPWSRFLYYFKARDLTHDQQLIFVNNTDTVLESLRTLTESKTQSTPVYDQDENKFIGSIDMLDLVAFLTFLRSDASVEESVKGLVQQPVGQILNLSHRNEWKLVSQEINLFEVIKMLSDPNLHRVGLTGENQKVVGLLSQSRIIEWFYAHKQHPAFPEDLKTKTVQEFHHAKVIKPVRTITVASTVLEGFREIFFNEVSALAIVNDKGEILGNLSASDLKWAARDDPEAIIEKLNCTLLDYLNLGREFAFTCKRQDSLETIMNKFNESKVHRLWVVDAAKQPIGVISLCDLLIEMTSCSRSAMTWPSQNK